MDSKANTYQQWESVLALARQVDDHYSMLEEQQAVLYDLALDVPAGGVIMELGVAYGKTSVVLGLAAKQTGARVYAVDDFSLVGSAQEYRDRMQSLDVPVVLFAQKTQEVEWEEEIDLLIIDAGHDDVNVRADCARWIPLVKPGGVVAFHDYEHLPADPMINSHWAVTVNADKFTRHWEQVAWVKQLMVRRRPVE